MVKAKVLVAGPQVGDEADPPLAGGSTSSPWGLSYRMQLIAIFHNLRKFILALSGF